MITIVIAVLAVFFAVNMGGSNFAVSFATAYGSRMLSRVMCGVLFVIFLALGATFCGSAVTLTLGKNIIPAHFVTPPVIVVIFLSAGMSMFVANLMKIPQTTTLVTVAAISGVGLHLNHLNGAAIMKMVPYWIGLPLVSYAFTYICAGLIYPPRHSNFWLYEKLVNNRQRLHIFVIACSCYNAFAIGTNNVANVVGPLVGIDVLPVALWLLIFAVIFGSGAFMFPGTLETSGNQVVPLGLLTASIISLVSGTLMIFASELGIPQSFVMLQMAAIFAVASIKKGKDVTFSDPITRRSFFTWTINPVITVGISFLLARLIVPR